MTSTSVSVATPTTFVTVDVRCPHERCQRRLAVTTAPLTKTIRVTCPRCRECVEVRV